MTYDRIDLRRTKRGPIVAVLFGATLQGGTLTAEAMLVPAPIPRAITAHFEKHKCRIPKLSPDFYGAIFGSEVPQFEVTT